MMHPLKLLDRLFGKEDDRAAVRPLYAAIVAEARAPHWYQGGSVPDTIDGRFEMITAILSLALVRLETLGAMAEAALLTEVFVEDMEGQLREIGIGDVVVGKHIGKMMSALGGRLGAYRAAVSGQAPLDDALVKNLYRGEAPMPDALTHVVTGLNALRQTLGAQQLAMLLSGAQVAL